MSTGYMKGQIFSGTNEIRVVVPAVYVSEAEAKIKRLYGASHVWNIDECDENGRTHYDRKPSSGGDSLGGDIAEAVVTAPFKVVGWGWNSIREGMDEAEKQARKEKKKAFKAGGQKLIEWKEKQAKEEKTASRVLRYGGGFVGCAILSGLVEGLAGPLSLVFWGYIGYRAYKQHQVKKEEAQAKKNRPAQVSHKYRTESFK